MSRPQLPKGKITRAPKDADFDQAILIFAVALGMFLVSFWLVWSNGQSAATAYMLEAKQVTAKGVVLIFQYENKKSISGYGFEDSSSKVWTKLKPSIFDLSSRFDTLRKFQDERIVKLLKNKTEKSGKLHKHLSYEEIVVYYHPDYPRFFAIAAERTALTTSFTLTIAGLVGLALSILMGWYSVRKYKRLKAIAAYY